MRKNPFSTMLTLKELRIGNVIQSIAQPIEELTVNASFLYHYEQVQIDGERVGDAWEGIPITERLLDRFGFVRYDEWMEEINAGITIPFRVKYSRFSDPGKGILLQVDIWTELEPTLGQPDGITVYYNESPIQKLHTLQNLYYALTQIELKQRDGVN